MDQQQIMALEAAHTSGVYPKRPLAIVRGQGARVWDADGNEYIDCAGGQGAANLGHAHPAIVAAIPHRRRNSSPALRSSTTTAAPSCWPR